MPRSKHIVNMEHLPDAGLPAGALTTWDTITAVKGMTFAADGTATVDFTRGNRHSGRWMADAEGHPHADWSGHHEHTVTRVGGDTLTSAR